MYSTLSDQLHQLSLWGKLHAVPARFLIAGGHFLLAGIALVLGAIWIPYEGKVLLIVQLLLFAAAGAIAIVYSKKKYSKGAAGWAGRKKGEGSMLTCGFLLLLLTGPALREDRLRFSMAPAYATTTHISPAKEGQTKVGSFFKKLRQRYIETSDAVRLLIALGAIALAIVAGFGIVGLACNLSCSGYGVAAAIVFFGGGGLLVTALVTILVRTYESKERASRRNARRAERRQRRLQRGEAY